MKCKNCGLEVTSNFCPECGQKSKVDKITFSYLINSIIDSVFQIEHGFFYTLKELILRPAKSIDSFIKGKRVNFYKPFAYVIIMTSITSFLVYLVELYVHSNLELSTIQIDPNTIQYYFMVASAIFSKYQGLFYFLMIPIISICSWSFFFRKFNYWENIVLNTYITAQFNLLIIVAQFSRIFLNGTVSYTPYLIIYFTYLGYVYSKFFSVNIKNRFLYALKLIALNFIIVFVYTTGLSLAGIMTPWW